MVRRGSILLLFPNELVFNSKYIVSKWWSDWVIDLTSMSIPAFLNNWMAKMMFLMKLVFILTWFDKKRIINRYLRVVWSKEPTLKNYVRRKVHSERSSRSQDHVKMSLLSCCGRTYGRIEDVWASQGRLWQISRRNHQTWRRLCLHSVLRGYL